MRDEGSQIRESCCTGSHLDNRAEAAASGRGGGLGVAVWGSFVTHQ